MNIVSSSHKLGSTIYIATEHNLFHVLKVKGLNWLHALLLHNVVFNNYSRITITTTEPDRDQPTL